MVSFARMFLFCAQLSWSISLLVQRSLGPIVPEAVPWQGADKQSGRDAWRGERSEARKDGAHWE
jgi:hypothetical protein